MLNRSNPFHLMVLSASLMLCLATASASDRNTCAELSSVGDECTVLVSEIHPTQIAVGLREARLKALDLGAMDDGKLSRYLSKHAAPATIAPDGGIYITDRHHLAYALHLAGLNTIIIQTQANWRGQAITFWPQMQAHGWIYPYNRNGEGPLPFSEIPLHVSDMQDDPYRSLAGAVRDAGGYDKTDTLYADFAWANFFRSRIALGQSDAEFQNAVEAGVSLASTPAASGLPGSHAAP